jgi:tetratricopeptide (TPR) repeat protein
MDKVERETDYLDDILQISSLPESGLIGREKELTQIKSHLERVHGEGGRLILIHGEAGMGKTSLLRELGQVIRKRGGTVLLGGCHEETRSIPYYPFREAFKLLFEKVGVEKIKPLLENLPEYSRKELDSILPELKETKPTEMERAQDPYRLFEAVRLFLQSLSDKSKIPLLCIAENLHYSDEASLDLLQYLARNLKGGQSGLPAGQTGMSILLCGTYRTEEVDPSRGIARLKASLQSERLLEEIKLQPLSLDGVSSMIHIHYPEVEISLDFQTFLFEKTEGNPLFVEEVLRSLDIEKIKKGGSLSSQWEVPQSIHAVIQNRVELIPPESKEILTCAAILGEVFEFEVLRRVLNRSDEEILEAVEVGIRSHIVRESALPDSGEGREEGEEQYRFMNALITDVLYSGIGKTRRRLWHGKAGEVLEEIYGGRLEELNGRLVYHFERGEKWEGALDYALKGAKKAKEDYANQEAIHLYEKAREMLIRLSQSTTQVANSTVGEEEEYAIAEGKGDVYKIIGNYEKAQEEYQLMEESARRQEDKKIEGKALDKRGDVYLQQGDFDDAMIYAERSYETYRKTDDKKGLAGSLGNIGVVHARRGDYEEALKCLEESLTVRREIGDKRDVAENLGHIGVVHGNRGNYGEALKRFEESLTIRRESRDKIGEAVSLKNIGLVHWSRGNYEEALNCYEKSLKIQREIGDKKGEALSLNSIGNVKLYQGEHGEALEWYDKTLAIQREIGDKWGIALTLQSIGVVHWNRGEYEDELKCDEESLMIRREIGDKSGIGMSLNNIGDVYRIRGDYDEALKCFDESLTIRREIGDKRYSAMTLRNTGEVHLNRGDYGKALQCLEESLEIQKETRSKKDLAQILTSMGTMHRSFYDTEKALDCHQESLTLVEEIGAKDEKARILTAIGTDYYHSGDEDKALQYLNEALDIALELELKGSDPVVWILETLSEIWLSKGDSNKARAFCERLLKISEKEGLKENLVRGRKIRGEILLKEVESSGPSTGSGQSSGSGSVADRVEDPIRVATTLKEAETELLEAKKIAEEIGASPLLWQIYASLGKVYSALEGLDDNINGSKATENFSKAKEIVQDIASKIGDEKLKNTFLNAKSVRSILEFNS